MALVPHVLSGPVVVGMGMPMSMVERQREVDVTDPEAAADVPIAGIGGLQTPSTEGHQQGQSEG